MMINIEETLGEVNKSDVLKLVLLCLAVGITVYVVRENNKLRQQLGKRRPCDEAVLEMVAAMSAQKAEAPSQGGVPNTKAYPDGAYKPGVDPVAPQPNSEMPSDLPVQESFGVNNGSVD